MDNEQAATLYFTDRNETVLAVVFACVRPFQTRPFENFLGLIEADLVVNEIGCVFFPVPLKLIIHVLYTIVYTNSSDLLVGNSQYDNVPSIASEQP